MRRWATGYHLIQLLILGVIAWSRWFALQFIIQCERGFWKLSPPLSRLSLAFLCTRLRNGRNIQGTQREMNRYSKTQKKQGEMWLTSYYEYMCVCCITPSPIFGPPSPFPWFLSGYIDARRRVSNSRSLSFVQTRMAWIKWFRARSSSFRAQGISGQQCLRRRLC